MRAAEFLRTRWSSARAGLLLACLLAPACSLPPLATWHAGRGQGAADVEIGTASWYGPGFHGKRTSSGERYDQYAMTAAHQTLPLGSLVRVRNLENGRTIDVRINDRGPFVDGRIIDLSYAAARRLGMVTPGTVRVGIQRLDDGSEAGLRVVWAVQTGAFAEAAHARRMQARLGTHWDDVYVSPYRTEMAMMHRVRLGPFGRRGDAIARADQLQRRGVRSLVVEEVVR